MEIWRKIEGFENYEVSNLGQVRSLNYKRTGEIKILIPCKNNNGYLKVVLCKSGKQHTKRVHRLVATAFIPNLEGKKEVNHIDGNKQNNKVENLEWCTNLENIQHAWETGLRNEETKKKLSEANKGKKLSEETRNKISEIKKGKHHTEQTRKKLSEANKGKYRREKHPQAKKVLCITTGEIFNCIKDAEEKYHIAHQSISKCCRKQYKSAGKHPITGEKLKWRFEETI